MSSAARRKPSSTSESPLYGPNFIFAHKMVAGHVEIDHLRANFPELYTLLLLTTLVLTSLATDSRLELNQFIAMATSVSIV